MQSPTAPPPARAPRFTRSRRAATRLTVVALAITGIGLTAAVPAQAADCILPEGKTASIQSVKVAPLYVLGTRNDFTIPVTVAVCDPANLVQGGIAVLGVKLLSPLNSTLIDIDFAETAPVGVGTLKSYSFALVNYYEPDFPSQIYGPMDVGAVIFDANGLETTPLDEKYATTTVKSRTYLTNTPTATTVRRGTTTVIRGVLRRFDGAPMANQRVAIKVVPAGWTRGSFAGYASTSSTGAFALTVRAYYTGSWYVNYAGNATAVASYKAAWVRVTP